MSTFNAFVTVGVKKYVLNLTSLTIESLKEQIVEVTKNEQQGNVLVKVTTCDGRVIEEEQHLQQAVANHQMDFMAYFQSKSVLKEEKKVMTYEMNDPLVLLTGAMQYDQRRYLDGVKKDLCLLQALFEVKFGYRVCNTYNPQNPVTESLTLKELENVIGKHCTDSGDNYDGLIFVWCGHGEGGEGLETAENTIITSDNKTKAFKDVQDEFAIKTDCFVGKPKIFIKIVSEEQMQDESDLTERMQRTKRMQHAAWIAHADVITIFANMRMESILDCFGNEHVNTNIASFFTRVFCQVIHTNLNKNLSFILNQVAQIAHQQICGRDETLPIENNNAIENNAIENNAIENNAIENNAIENN
ncbi:hypothetical protein RFI_22227, partial [Reticulomyxa filosa]